MNVLSAIGNTSLVEIKKVVPEGCARIYAKLEWENPTGSMKDRVALAMIKAAETDGRLKPGGTVVEYTGGSTGTSLALVCAARGYKLQIATSDAFSRDKLNQMRALGAELHLVPSEGGKTTKRLIQAMIARGRELAAASSAFLTNQLENQDSIPGYFKLAEEIWQQTDCEVDAFVHCVGTGASSRGVATQLKRRNSEVAAYAVEPAESPVLSGGEGGAHKIEGVGVGFIPPLWDESVMDGVITVATDDAKDMARRLAREEGLFAGTSSGANVLAAIEVGTELGPDATVVTLMCDSGLRYLSTDLFGD